MSLSPQRRLLQIALAIMVQVSLLPGAAIGLGCQSQRMVADDCCCVGASDPVADPVQGAENVSCCGQVSDASPHDEAPKNLVVAASDSSCACEVSPADPLPAPREAIDDSGPRAKALPASSAEDLACDQNDVPRRHASGAGQARSGPPIYLLNQIFLI